MLLGNLIHAGRRSAASRIAAVAIRGALVHSPAIHPPRCGRRSTFHASAVNQQRGDPPKPAAATRLTTLTSSGNTFNALSQPIYQASSFEIDDGNPYDYTRSGNPVRSVLQEVFADVAGGAQGFAFTSGMAALTAVLRATTRQGDVVVTGSDLYGGTHRLLSAAQRRGEVDVKFVDLSSPEGIAEAMRCVAAAARDPSV